MNYLASTLGQVFTKEQIFEEVWHMDINSCYTVVINDICCLRAKIEPDRENPTYTKTVYGEYEFNA
ncbi:winged helix-turn-helix domain-containing protein [Gottschalkia purinilytica]|uniref:winged helix-turn-helix domain-containing protein n=1 Tax=Gottschalkia purinilytica TaxID=1503 RepID=UPI0009E63D47